ncbi:fasciclin domain-containing protein [Sphingomonas oligophenolica]|uniref:Fasciclin domain-containing protein n=1 Tax=Sphingomonas oligophenolica TaxID=301154 RepID=A0A502CGH0_9SPHN|nr:fasciclin domain-containing protein [Sphingomonas oligophenolica]TPG12078.1 fasciclin domain-containing protein [Sphingomonas oligophenolica]
MTRAPFLITTAAAALALAGCSTMNDDMAAPASMSSNTSASTKASTMTPAGNPTVGGAAMIQTKTIVENASAAPNLTTLVAAVKAAGLVDTLSGPGPFTVFAPTNDAFGLLAPGTVDTLLKPENKASLVKVLTYHVVPGTITSAMLMKMIKDGGGSATLTTVAGQPITATMEGSAVKLTSATGNVSFIQTADVRQSNGMVHVVNGVLIPTLG